MIIDKYIATAPAAAIQLTQYSKKFTHVTKVCFLFLKTTYVFLTPYRYTSLKINYITKYHTCNWSRIDGCLTLFNMNEFIYAYLSVAPFPNMD